MRRTTLALPCLALLATGFVTQAPHASVCANYTADNGDEVTCDLPADGEVFVSTVHAEEHDDGEFVWSDFTHIEWRFSLEGSDHTGEVRERTEAEVAEAAATRDEAVAAAKKAAAKKIKRAKKQRAREIRLAEKGYASAAAPYEVVEPITVLLENTREV